MSLSREEAALMEKRDTDLSSTEKGLIEDAMAYLEQRMQDNGINPAGDDRAARLEAAMVRFVIDCKQSTKPAPRHSGKL